jgi:hypothetical protein
VSVCRLLTRGEAWVDRGAATFERRRTVRELTSLNSKALNKDTGWLWFRSLQG